MANFPWIFQDGGIRAVTSCQLAFQHNAGKKVGLGNICFQLVLEHIFFKKNSASQILIEPFLHKYSLHCSSIKVQPYISKARPLNVRGQR